MMRLVEERNKARDVDGEDAGGESFSDLLLT